MKVFLSSTAQDLVDYRKMADDTILRLQQQSTVMERFGPLSGAPVAECERLARESDVVVCIVAHRYGFVPEAGKGSITEREVRAAHAAGKAVLAWIIDDKHPWTQAKEQDLLADPTVLVDQTRIADVAAGMSALLAFKAWLRSTFICDTFTTSDELGRKISIALQDVVLKQLDHTRLVTPKLSEIRIVHALQPAPHFHGRDTLVQELTDWAADLASRDRVWALVAAGGTGKTAIAERVVRDMQPGEANVLVWSFYENPDTNWFLRECNALFLGEEEGPAGGRLERLERGLRDGRPHLIVLDGLERVQEDSVAGRVRGELSSQTLKLLLRALAAGLGRARALVTSRFPLVDLQDWTDRGYRDTRLDDLSSEAAVAVLRGWGVIGEEMALRAAVLQVGHHALSVAVIGSYLRSFANGRIEEVAQFKLDEVTGEDAKAARLARVLASYAQRLPAEERELLARLSVFPRGVTRELLETLIDAGGEVAGSLIGVKPQLPYLLNILKARGLVFAYTSDVILVWTAHPFLRDRFRELLGCPPEHVFNVVAGSLSSGLERKPKTKPRDPRMLDRYEQLIEVLRLGGREEEAFDLFWQALGSYRHLGYKLGEYERGYRILIAFGGNWPFKHLALTIPLSRRSLLANDLALYAFQLGRLNEAWAVRQLDNRWKQTLRDPKRTVNGLLNSSEVAFARGQLVESYALANTALILCGDLLHDLRPESGDMKQSLSFRAAAAHAMGNISEAKADFAAATDLELGPLYSLRGAQHARHLLDLGNLTGARELCADNIAWAKKWDLNQEFPRFRFLLSQIALTEKRDPAPHLDKIRAWTTRTSQMQPIIEAHLLTACHLLTTGNLQAALGEAKTGLLNAVTCGYRLLHIELLITLGRIQLAWPDATRAIKTSYEAFELAKHQECQYAWGQADAAQVCGEAFLANHQPTQARRALEYALMVRKRIEHPGVAETRQWLARVGRSA